MLLCESAVVVFYLLLLDHTPQDWATILPQPRRDAVSHTFPRKFRDPASVRRKPGFFFLLIYFQTQLASHSIPFKVFSC